MVSCTKKRGKNGISRAGRKKRAESRRAKEEAERAMAAHRERRANAFRSFGRKAAAALFVCGAFAIGINSNDNRADFSKKGGEMGREKEKAGNVSIEEERGREMGIGGIRSLKRNPFRKTKVANWNPWDRVSGARNSLGYGFGDIGVSGGENGEAGSGRGTGESGGGKGESPPPKRRERGPNEVVWENTYLFPPRRERFSLDPLEPEDEGEGGKGGNPQG